MARVQAVIPPKIAPEDRHLKDFSSNGVQGPFFKGQKLWLYSQENLQWLQNLINIEFSLLGMHLLVRELDLDALENGIRLQTEQCLLEIMGLPWIENRRFSNLHVDLAQWLLHRPGKIARVIQGGTIQTGEIILLK